MNNNLIQHEPAFDVIGIAIRTTNQAAMEQGTIGMLWQQFFVESVYAAIPDKVDHAIVAVYYDFEDGKKGEYNLLIGARVSSVDDIPAGMMAVHVPEQKRMVFTSPVGLRSEIVFELWQEIWQLEDQGTLNRAYTADYEVYDERSQDPQHAQIEIHIGLQ